MDMNDEHPALQNHDEVENRHHNITMPNPESLLRVLFGRPHNAALIMLLTDTYLTGEAVCNFVYDGRVGEDPVYEFYCTGTIVQTRTFVAWLSKEGVELSDVPDYELCLLGVVRVGKTEHHLAVRFTGGINIVDHAFLSCSEDRACFMSGTDCVTLIWDEPEEDGLDLRSMQRLSIGDDPEAASYMFKDEFKDGVRVMYVPTDERTVRAEYHRMPIWGQDAVLGRYIDHVRDVNLDIIWNYDLGNLFAEGVTMLTMDDDLTENVPALNGTMDPLAFVRGWLAQLAVGLGVVSLNNDTDEETIVSKLAYNDRGLCMVRRRHPGESAPNKWPQIRDNMDEGLAGLQELAYGVSEYFAMNIACYERCAIPI